ncbi:MAG: FtsX-like permease family protein [Desulfurococcales archaeon]|nr:FtsX-like permease family protein [Desulfurococcales archaeon]
MVLYRAMLRTLLQRRLETAAIVVIVMVAVMGLASVKLASSYALFLSNKAWTYEVGNIIVDGSFPGPVLTEIDGLEGVQRVKLLKITLTTGEYNGEPVSVALVYNPSDSYPFSYIKEGDGRVLVFTTTGKALVNVGDRITVPGLGDVTVEGRALGVARVVSADIVLFVPKEMEEAAEGVKISAVSIVSAENVNVSKLAEQVKDVIEEGGGSVNRVTVITEEDNPARRPMEAVAESFTMFVSLALISTSLIVLGAEASLLEREVRQVGVLKAVGLSRAAVIALFGGYNLVRGLIGAVLGVLLAIPLSEKLVILGGLGPHAGVQIRILVEKFPFHPDIWSVLEILGIALLIVALVSIIPPALFYRVPTGRALRFTGLTGRTAGRLFSGRPLLAFTIRRIISRPWLALTLTVLIALSWGAVASIPMSLRGVGIIEDEIKWYNYDAVIQTAAPPSMASKVVDLALNVTGVKGAEAWLMNDGIARLNGDRLLAMTCLGEWRLTPRLVEGRWPSKGEVVVSETLSKDYGLHVGDPVTLELGGRARELKVVGVVADHRNNGRVIFLSPEDYLGVVKEDWITLHIASTGDPAYTALQVKYALIESGIPSIVLSTKEDLIEGQHQMVSFMNMVMLIVNTANTLAGFIGIGVLLAIDLAGRLRELGVLRAVGFTTAQKALLISGQIPILSLVSAPLALLLGYIISKSMLTLMEPAVGYLSPIPNVVDVIKTGWVVLGAFILGLALSAIYLRRQSTGSLLRAE